MLSKKVVSRRPLVSLLLILAGFAMITQTRVIQAEVCLPDQNFQSKQELQRS